VTTNWSQVPGSNLTSTIDPVGRDTNGGTYNFFLQAVLNNQNPSSKVNALTADGLVINAVKSDPNAIGYAGLAWQGSGVRR
jgi:ABC-type phosphate transport system, periplasmic component